jgi:glycosyltransferase involved in cell wall biosynthesis
VILPVYNGADTIATQLAAISDQDYTGEWELIAVDNMSTDETRAILDRWAADHPNTRVVDATSGRGVAVARNCGVSVARGDLLAFCDADDAVDRGWLSAIVKAAEEADLVAGREVRVVANRDGVLDPRPARWQPSPGRSRHLGFLPFAVGGNAAVWRSVIDDVGGWDPEFRRGQDAEFSWRAQVAGYRFAYAADATVYYRDRARLRDLMSQHYGWGLSDARLLAMYREAGCPETPWSVIVRRTLWMVLHSLDLVRSRWRRAAYLKVVAGCAGRLVGSRRYQVRLF